MNYLDSYPNVNELAYHDRREYWRCFFHRMWNEVVYREKINPVDLEDVLNLSLRFDEYVHWDFVNKLIHFNSDDGVHLYNVNIPRYCDPQNPFEYFTYVILVLRKGDFYFPIEFNAITATYHVTARVGQTSVLVSACDKWDSLTDDEKKWKFYGFGEWKGMWVGDVFQDRALIFKPFKKLILENKEESTNRLRDWIRDRSIGECSGYPVKKRDFYLAWWLVWGGTDSKNHFMENLKSKNIEVKLFGHNLKYVNGKLVFVKGDE